MEITCKTMQSRLLMAPRAELEDLVLGVLGRAQALTGMRIFGYTFLSNHFHLMLGPASARQLARFMCFLNSNIAREVGRLCAWRTRFWSRRYAAIAISDEEAAQVGRLRYVLAHGAKEGLVRTPREWPGAHCVRALLAGRSDVGTWFDRTKEYNDRRRGLVLPRADYATRYTVALSPLPCWAHVEPAAYRERIRELVAGIERDAASHAAQTGRSPRGAFRLRRQDPHARPIEPARRPAPSFHCVSHEARRLFMAAYRIFVGAYRAAARRLAAGDFSVRFPEDCFPPPWPNAPAPR